METKNIYMIPITKICPHPDNPRKNLGELEELAESIKANGILQNLTVVPYVGEETGNVIDGLYRCVIGHRRLAASKLAGLEELPCTIAHMTISEQVKTMLMENMQRSDLTPVEQADGFQMMLDLGYPLQEISEKSGFSQSTIRHRLKLRELDRKVLEERVTQGATLMDLIKLEQIEDEKDRNKALSSIGTSNFAYVLQSAMNTQTTRANKPKWIELFDGFARKLSKEEADGPCWRHRRYCSISMSPDTFLMPEDDGGEYGYTVDYSSITLYVKVPDAEQREQESKALRERKARIQEVETKLMEITRAAYQLRFNFVKENSLRKKDADMALRTLTELLADVSNSGIRNATLFTLMGIKQELDYSERIAACKAAFAELMQKDADKATLYVIYSVFGDEERLSYMRRVYVDNIYPAHVANPQLDKLYDFLEQIGYQISDEERLLMSGKHPLFQAGKEASQEHTCRVCGVKAADDAALDWAEQDLCNECAEFIDQEEDG